MKEYEIIGKDVYGTQAVTKNNTTNCSNCRYKKIACHNINCKDFFYLKDEDLEKINNEKIQQLESRIKELEEKKKKHPAKLWEMSTTIVEKLKLATEQEKSKIDWTTLEDEYFDWLEEELNEKLTTELISELEDYFGIKTNILKTKCCGIAPITTENYCPNCGRKIKK